MTSFRSSLSSEENMTDWELNIDCRFLNVNTNTSSRDSKPITQCQGLSLSLGSELNQYTNLSFCSLLTSDIQPENNGLTSTKYLSFDMSGRTGASVENENVNWISSNRTSVFPPLQQTLEYTGVVYHSKYLVAAQDLLNEVVNVHKVLEQSEKSRKRETSVQKYEHQESTANVSLDLSQSTRQDLHNKMTKLLTMLDEVDKWYKHYFHQMQALVSSFEMVVGPGSAKQYTTLALQTISRQFRSLRDAIKKQIQDSGKKLGNQDQNPQFSRLKYVDQQLRQRKALHQFGIMGQPWRPQRGLPETAVSVLRAWLFEHFLNPYPKESEKILLAKQAGLSRSQVANWFINARVRLWKPMIEDIYKEEFGDAETINKSPSEYAQRSTREISGFDEKQDEYQVKLTSDTAINPCGAELSYEAGYIQDSDVSFTSTHYPSKKARANDVLPDDNTMFDHVSLALGLQNSESDLQPNDHMTSSIGLEKLEYYVTDLMNNQHKFATLHMLSDFVA